MHVTPDNFCNGLLVESFSSSVSRREKEMAKEKKREKERVKLGPINYTERIVNAVKWSRRGPSTQRDENVSVFENFHSTIFLGDSPPSSLHSHPTFSSVDATTRAR